MSRTTIRQPREGDVRLGAITFKVTGSETDGALTVAEYVVPSAWSGPPAHRHDYAESFLVVEGALRFIVDAEAVEGGPGTFIYVPGGVTHGFSNPSDAPARMYFFLTPAGFERYFDELERALDGTFPPDPETAARVILPLMAKYGVETVQHP